MKYNNNAIQGASDLYNEMLKVKNKVKIEGGSIPNTWITKAQAKRLGIDWSFVENSANILNLKIVRNGKIGYSIQQK